MADASIRLRYTKRLPRVLAGSSQDEYRGTSRTAVVAAIIPHPFIAPDPVRPPPRALDRHHACAGLDGVP
jgi:hypothetical protein